MDNFNFKNMVLAYNAVHDNVLRESMEELGFFGETSTEQDDFENWVNGLLDEGYDLSDYTWDELYEDYRTLPVGKMMRQAASKPVKAAAEFERSGPQGLGVMVAGVPNWRIRRALKDAKKMARVAARHSLIKGKGRIRGEGQALLNRLRGEAKRSQDNNGQINASYDYNIYEGLGGVKDQDDSMERLNKRAENYYNSLEPFKNRLKQKQKAEEAQKFLTKHPKKRKTQKEQYDIYDLVLEYLIDEGYAESLDNAEAIMANMSEDWVLDIVEKSGYGDDDAFKSDPSAKPGFKVGRTIIPSSGGGPSRFILDKISGRHTKGPRLGGSPSRSRRVTNETPRRSESSSDIARTTIKPGR